MEDCRIPQQATQTDTVEDEGIQEEARTAKDKLERHRETQPEERGHHLGGSQGTDSRQDRMMSTCGPMFPTGHGINRREQNM